MGKWPCKRFHTAKEDRESALIAACFQAAITGRSRCENLNRDTSLGKVKVAVCIVNESPHQAAATATGRAILRRCARTEKIEPCR
jgi:hypothetical protein